MIRIGCFIDLTGQTFGKLTVIKRAEDKILPSGQHQTMWLCQCSCGNQTTVRGAHLTKGKTISCGCYKKEIISECHTTNMVGWIMAEHGVTESKLTVISREKDYISPHFNRSLQYRCRCECGNEKNVTASALKSGDTLSCGYLKSSGEYNVIQYLSNNEIEFETQKRFNDSLECQGQQHYFPVKQFGGDKQFISQQKHDELKRNYAKENNYHFWEIKYEDYTNIEILLDKKILEIKERINYGIYTTND